LGRKNKAHEARRGEILDAAWKLFTERGYEGTTVASIIDALGISKGTFYHYFQSKEQVLDAISDRLGQEPLSLLQAVVDDPSLRAGAKLDQFMRVARQSRLSRVDAVVAVARVLYREENLIIRHKVNARLTALTRPLLTQIMDQGIQEGAFQVSNADEASNVIWLLSESFADQQMQTLLGPLSNDQKVAAMVQRAQFAVESLERILGMREQTLTRPSEQMLRLFVNAVATARQPGCDSA